MVIDIREAYDLMEFLKKLKPEAGVHVAEHMVGKFRVRLKVFDLSLLSENIFFYNFNNLFIP